MLDELPFSMGKYMPHSQTINLGEIQVFFFLLLCLLLYSTLWETNIWKEAASQISSFWHNLWGKSENI